jgi:hypothetical protein
MACQYRFKGEDLYLALDEATVDENSCAGLAPAARSE